CRFASCGPEREIGHARRPLQLNAVRGSQPVHQRIKEGAEDARARNFKLAPKFSFGTPLRLRNVCQGQKDRPVPEVRSADNLLNPVQKDGACCLKQYLLVVRVELPYGEAAAGREPAKGIREPVG